jgi:hypothetical protein
LEPDTKFEGSVCLHLGRRARFHASGKFVIVQNVDALISIANPVAQSRDVLVSFRHDAFFTKVVYSVLVPGRFRWTNHAAFLIDPHTGRDIDELKDRTDSVMHVDESREAGFRSVVPLTGSRFATSILRSRDDFKI